MHNGCNILYITECRITLKSVDNNNGLFHFYFIFLTDINNIVRFDKIDRLFSYIIASTFILHTLINLNFKENLTGGLQ